MAPKHTKRNNESTRFESVLVHPVLLASIDGEINESGTGIVPQEETELVKRNYFWSGRTSEISQVFSSLFVRVSNGGTGASHPLSPPDELRPTGRCHEVPVRGMVPEEVKIPRLFFRCVGFT